MLLNNAICEMPFIYINTCAPTHPYENEFLTLWLVYFIVIWIYIISRKISCTSKVLLRVMIVKDYLLWYSFFFFGMMDVICRALFYNWNVFGMGNLYYVVIFRIISWGVWGFSCTCCKKPNYFVEKLLMG